MPSGAWWLPLGRRFRPVGIKDLDEHQVGLHCLSPANQGGLVLFKKGMQAGAFVAGADVGNAGGAVAQFGGDGLLGHVANQFLLARTAGPLPRMALTNPSTKISSASMNGSCTRPM